jgi:hypothetical protein
VAPALPTIWLVGPGDDLWSIADRALVTAWGRQPTVGEVAGYWVEVIALNRSRLPQPDDPGLIFPGDQIALPPVAPAPA